MFLGSVCNNMDQEEVVPEPVSLSGRDYAFVSDNLILLANDNKEAVRATDPQKVSRLPSFLPSGQEIIYIEEEDGFRKFNRLNLKTRQVDFIYATKGEPTFYIVSPNGKFLLYLENETLYLLDINNKETEKIAEHVNSPAWSEDSKSFIYVGEEGALFLREFNINQELQDEKEIIKEDVGTPKFIGLDMIVFERCKDEKCNLVIYDLFKQEKNRDLKEYKDTQNPNPDILVSPDKKMLILTRQDEVTALPIAEIIEISSGKTLVKYEDARYPVWNKESNNIFYEKQDLDLNNDLGKNIYLGDLHGQDSVFMEKAEQFQALGNNFSNTISQ